MIIRLLIPLAVVTAAFSQVPARAPQPPQPARPAPQRGPAPVAQPNAPRPMDGDLSGLRTYLNLTEAQVSQLRQAGDRARRDAEEKARTNGPEIQEKRMALEDLLAKGTTDATAVGRLMLDIRSLEKQVRDAHEAVRTSQLNILTPEQRNRFREIEEEASRPQAIQEARRLGMVNGPPQGQPVMQNQPGPIGPRPAMQNRPQMRPQGPPRPPNAPNPPRQGDEQER